MLSAYLLHIVYNGYLRWVCMTTYDNQNSIPFKWLSDCSFCKVCFGHSPNKHMLSSVFWPDMKFFDRFELGH